LIDTSVSIFKQKMNDAKIPSIEKVMKQKLQLINARPKLQHFDHKFYDK